MCSKKKETKKAVIKHPPSDCRLSFAGTRQCDFYGKFIHPEEKTPTCPVSIARANTNAIAFQRRRKRIPTRVFGCVSPRPRGFCFGVEIDVRWCWESVLFRVEKSSSLPAIDVVNSIKCGTYRRYNCCMVICGYRKQFCSHAIKEWIRILKCQHDASELNSYLILTVFGLVWI